MKFKALTIIITIFVFGLSAAASAPQEKTFAQVQDHLAQLYEKKDFKAAVQVLEKAKKQFPDHAYDVALSLMWVHMEGLQQNDKAIEAAQWGLTKGAFFALDELAQYYPDFAKQPGFKTLLKENNRIKAGAVAKAKVTYDVVKPTTFSADKKHPLFIVLHGGSGNKEQMIKLWKSEIVSREFLVAAVDSSQMMGMKMFTWENLETARKDIKFVYDDIISKYPVDTTKVFIGGWSMGSRTAIDTALRQVIPVTGFTAFAPGLGEGYTLPGLDAAVAKGLKGTIVVGDKDHNLKDAEKIATILKTKLDVRFIVIPGQKHRPPKDLPAKLDEAVKHVLHSH